MEELENEYYCIGCDLFWPKSYKCQHESTGWCGRVAWFNAYSCLKCGNKWSSRRIYSHECPPVDGDTPPMLSVFRHLFQSSGRIDSKECLSIFRTALDDPNLTQTILTHFLKKMGYPRSKGGGGDYYKGLSLKGGLTLISLTWIRQVI